MNFDVHSLLLILVIAGITIGIRFLPFLIFRDHAPALILYLGEVLPYAIMGMLIVYCLKDVSLTSGLHGVPEAICVLLVILLEKWKHNTLLSILAGTVVYMFLISALPGLL
ncbi:MAG: branched-chain amino acid transporter permease [Lachnospiraceae bacterium]